MIRAVCFDMDGLLLDTERLSVGLMGDAVALQGYRIGKDRILSLTGASMADTSAALAAWCPGIDTDRFMRDWFDVTMAYMRRNGLPVKPGAAECLRLCRDLGLPTALCTSNAPKVVEEYLAMAGWQTMFDAVVTAGNGMPGKPAPDIYLQAAKLLDADPADCIGAEDSPGGVRALRAAGMRSVMIPDLIPYTEALAPYCDLVLKDLASFGTLLKEEMSNVQGG